MKKILFLLFPALLSHAAPFPTPYDSEPDKSLPMPAAEAAAGMRLPPGFKATVFAAEPDVRNPIAMSWDARGRLWVAENYTYAERALKFDLNLRDRILIFEDTDGDGHFDKRTVFTDEVQMLTSIEVGLGGVWVMCPPQLLFIPDRNHDDGPDGPAEVVLDGFTVPPENYHNFANGLRSARQSGVFLRMKPPQRRCACAASIASVPFKDRWRSKVTPLAKRRSPPSSKANVSSPRHARFKKHATPSRPMTFSPNGNPRQKRICWQRTASS